MRKALTDKTLEALKPAVQRYEVHDLHCPGLSVRVSTEGRKTFTVKFRYGVKQKRLSLGVYPRLPLAKARQKAICALQQLDEGIDPASRRRQPDRLVKAVCAEFIKQYAKPRNRNWREAERVLEREFVAVAGERDIREVRRADVLEILDGALERGAGYQANRILATIRKLYNWCIERDIVETNPIVGLKAPTREKSRDRVLKDEEIGRLLQACRNEAYPFRHYVPLLLATAQRRAETAAMRWDEVDLDAGTWVIPAENAKNGKPHVVPLSDFAVRILPFTPNCGKSGFDIARSSKIRRATYRALHSTER